MAPCTFIPYLYGPVLERGVHEPPLSLPQLPVGRHQPVAQQREERAEGLGLVEAAVVGDVDGADESRVGDEHAHGAHEVEEHHGAVRVDEVRKVWRGGGIGGKDGVLPALLLELQGGWRGRGTGKKVGSAYF